MVVKQYFLKWLRSWSSSALEFHASSMGFLPSYGLATDNLLNLEWTVVKRVLPDLVAWLQLGRWTSFRRGRCGWFTEIAVAWLSHPASSSRGWYLATISAIRHVNPGNRLGLACVVGSNPTMFAIECSVSCRCPCWRWFRKHIRRPWPLLACHQTT